MDAGPRLKLSRLRVACQILIHLAIVMHVWAWYSLGWRGVAGVDFQDFFHGFVAEGIVGIAALFAALVYALSLVFGRLFCSWGCHFAALQDLAAWILRRARIEPPLVRTRILHWSPALVLLVAFGLPAWRAWTTSGWRWRVEEGGLLAGAGPWDRLPGVAGSVLTLLVCGGALLLFLGTRGFCRFVCPYGLVFRIGDLVSPFRVRKRRDCAVGCAAGCAEAPASNGSDVSRDLAPSQVATTPPCTSVCPTAIDVHRETQDTGRVTSLDCVQCHLCIEACPSNALGYGRALKTDAPPHTPPHAPSHTPPHTPPPASARGPGRPYELGLAEEILALLVAIGTFALIDLVFAGHFLAATLALIESVLAVAAWRTLSRRDASLFDAPLRLGGRFTALGVAAVGLLALSTAPLYHAGSYHWHRSLGLEALEARELPPAESGPVIEPEDGDSPTTAGRALELTVNTDDRRALAEATQHLERALRRVPEDRIARRAICLLYERLGDRRALEHATELALKNPRDRLTLEMLRRLFLRFGELERARFIEGRLRTE